MAQATGGRSKPRLACSAGNIAANYRCSAAAHLKVGLRSASITPGSWLVTFLPNSSITSGCMGGSDCEGGTAQRSQWLLERRQRGTSPTCWLRCCFEPHAAPTLFICRATAMWASIQRCIHAWSVTFQLSAAGHVPQCGSSRGLLGGALTIVCMPAGPPSNQARIQLLGIGLSGASLARRPPQLVQQGICMHACATHRARCACHHLQRQWRSGQFDGAIWRNPNGSNLVQTGVPCATA